MFAFFAGAVSGWVAMHEILKRTKKHTLEVNIAKAKTDIEIAKNETTTGMRKFSEREKQAIKKMTDGATRSYSYVLVNSYDDIFFYRKVEFHFDEDQSILVFCKEKPQDISSDEILEIENAIMEVSLLIGYLRSNGLIYLIEDSKQQKPERDIANFDKQNYPYEISKDLDQKVAKELYQSMNHRIFVGQTLKDYVANGFKSLDELTLEEAQQQTKETRNLVIEAQKQSQAAVEQVAEAKRQADAADLQVKEATRQANAAEVQATEAAKQTKFAQTQTENAQTQTQLAQEQTKSAHWQTIISLVAVTLSIVAIIVGAATSIWVAKNIVMDVKVDSTQIETITSKINGIEERIDSVNLQIQRSQYGGVNNKVNESVKSKK